MKQLQWAEAVVKKTGDVINKGLETSVQLLDTCLAPFTRASLVAGVTAKVFHLEEKAITNARLILKKLG